MSDELTLVALRRIAEDTPLEIGWEKLDASPADVADLEQTFANAHMLVPHLEVEFAKMQLDITTDVPPEDIVDDLYAGYRLLEASKKYYSVLELIGS